MKSGNLTVSKVPHLRALNTTYNTIHRSTPSSITPSITPSRTYTIMRSTTLSGLKSIHSTMRSGLTRPINHCFTLTLDMRILLQCNRHISLRAQWPLPEMGVRSMRKPRLSWPATTAALLQVLEIHVEQGQREGSSLTPQTFVHCKVTVMRAKIVQRLTYQTAKRRTEIAPSQEGFGLPSTISHWFRQTASEYVEEGLVNIALGS
jgi:hypothetical protein